MEKAPRQSYRLIKKVLPKRLVPWVRGVKRSLLDRPPAEEPYSLVYTHAQASMERQQNVVQLCSALVEDSVEGAFVEFGVLDGGVSALMAWCARGEDREIHCFDAWEGLPESTEADEDEGRAFVGHCVGSPARVLGVMRKVGARMDCVHLHHGWFHETFPDALSRIDHIAFMHVDCDFHDPVQLCLETWYDRLVPGGCVQIDDYKAFIGCRRAVDAFLASRPEIELSVGEHGGSPIWFRKPAA